MVAMDVAHEQHPPQTRQQRFLRAAAEHVQAIKDEQGECGKEWEQYRTIYGSLCHKLPVLVMANGLAQTIAFVEAKAKAPATAPVPDKARARAYWRLRAQLADALGWQPAELGHRIRTAPLGQYIHATRTILAAWVYYKRFAESILDVQADVDPGDDRGDGE
jgi:CRISPR-associated protein Cmr5